MRNHQPVTIGKFNGIWDRSYPDDVPIGKLLDGKNLIFKKNGIETRPGFSNNGSYGGLTAAFAIKRIETYKRIGEADRLLILDNNYHVYDSTNLSSPILTVSGMTDFSVLSLYNRAYISPHNGSKGLAGQSVYVYQGSGTARLAAGNKPAGTTLTITNSVSAGNVEAGEHLYCVSYLTDTGFVTKPSLYTLYTAPGSLRIHIAGIPTGPAGTSGRVISATRVLVDPYNLNPDSYEYFELYTINDNTTTYIDIDYFDTDLQASNDTMLDNFETIPAGVCLSEYHGGMVVVGTDANPDTAFISKSISCEAFSTAADYVNVNPGDACVGIKEAVEFRDMLYFLKDQRMYSTTDTSGTDPSTWPVTPVDSGISTSCHGVGRILDAKGNHIEKFIFADRSGLVLFDGSTAGARLSRDIENIWKRINPLYFDRIEVCIDPVNFYIYVAVPLDAATENSHILFGDYSNNQQLGILDQAIGDALTVSTIKWSVWAINNRRPTSMVVDVDYTTKRSILKIGSLDHDIHALTDFANPQRNDTDGAIESYGRLPYTPTASDNKLFHFGSIRYRVFGNGSLNATLYTYDDAYSEALHSILLNAGDGMAPQHLINFISEAMSLKLGCNYASHWFSLMNLAIFVKRHAESRPLV